jgi:hypothetical protein
MKKLNDASKAVSSFEDVKFEQKKTELAEVKKNIERKHMYDYMMGALIVENDENGAYVQPKKENEPSYRQKARDLLESILEKDAGLLKDETGVYRQKETGNKSVSEYLAGSLAKKIQYTKIENMSFKEFSGVVHELHSIGYYSKLNVAGYHPPLRTCQNNSVYAQAEKVAQRNSAFLSVQSLKANER